MRPRPAILAAGLLAAALAGAGAARAADATVEVLWSSDSLAYVAWPGGTPGPGARAVHGAAARPETLEVAWARDAIAALRPLHGAPAPRRGAMLVPLVPPVNPDPPRGLLRVPLAGDAQQLDPLYAVALAEKQVVTQIFAGLVRLDGVRPPQPSLAAAWTRDGARHLFTLREDARFHDGRPVTAADVRATLLRALSPRAKAPRVEDLAAAIDGGRACREGRVDTIAGVRVLDPRTIEISAASPRAPLLDELARPAAFVVPAGTPPQPMDERTLLAAQSGPFYVTGSTARALSLAAAPGRRGGPAALDLVRVSGPAGAAVEFELGRLDVVAPPQATEGRMRAAAGDDATAGTVHELATYYLGFDTRHPFLAEREHRRALAGLIDRALAVKVLVPGRGTLARALLPPSLDPKAPPESLWMMPRARAEALAQGGFAGTAPELSFWIPAGSEVGLRLAEFVAAAWRRAGLRVTIVERPWPEFRRGVAAGEADVFYWSWFADGPDPVAFLAAMVESTRQGEGGNRTAYASTDVDRELAAARGAPSDEAAFPALRSAQLLALADAPLVPLFHPVSVTIVRAGVRDVPGDPFGAPCYDAVKVLR
jgi:ABC-type transport system substrate-binding protein